MTILRDLRRRVRGTAPAVLLGEAIERLRVRAMLMTRSTDQASRSLANVDTLVEKARGCGRICFNRQKINLSQVFAGQSVGIKQVDERI